MATKKWFVLIGSEEMGPLGPGGLRKLVRRGEIVANSLLRREDQTELVPATRVCGLIPEPHPELSAAHARPRAKMYGPFTSLRVLGWPTVAALFAFALLGAVGVAVAIWQLRFVGRFETEPLLVEEGVMMLFGIGVFAVLALVAVGALFLWWLWTARVNLPHLINARIHDAPSWVIMAWFLPFINLVRPYQVISEVDRLSAEAEADGDATVPANHSLLAPWWTTALLGTALALVYMLVATDTIQQLQLAAWVHLAAGLCTLVSGTLAAIIVLRIMGKQERAHDRHPEPVEVHHAFSHRRMRKASARVAGGAATNRARVSTGTR